jgi:8-oxo-dGTP pyrophosphatase MutT (NUDIX family)
VHTRDDNTHIEAEPLAGEAPAVIRRLVARVLLFDHQDRLLMFYVREPSDPIRGAWWYLPGGGMEPGESPEQAARRELYEETGIENASIGPVVLERRGVHFRFGGRDFEQDEWHVFGRVPDGGTIAGGSDDLEADAVAAHRWWTLADLATTAEIVYPPDLAVTVGRLLHEGPPPAPWGSAGSDVGTTQDTTPTRNTRP